MNTAPGVFNANVKTIKINDPGSENESLPGKKHTELDEGGLFVNKEGE